MPLRSTRPSSFSIAVLMRLHRRSRTSKYPRSARSPFAILTPKMRMSQLWSEIRFKATWIFWRLIPATRWLHEFVPSLLPAAKLLPGDARVTSILRRHIGLTCAGIHAARMSLTRAVAWPICPQHLIRRRLSLSSLTTCRRRRKKRSYISAGQCWSLMTQNMGSSRHRLRRYFSSRRRRQTS